ncbi:MAG: hypothetical protein BWK80_50120 [Desulfobacteraceae bacterium IS3]|nr:MAG: hypothetical protein BWK80_50120 [Desulfobacteraceae bacterium IS3]
MYNSKIERISEILCLLLHIMGGESFSKTKLVKLLYLLDVVKSRKGVPKFSGITFKSYYYGPYSDEIEESISLLSSLGYVTIKKDIGFSGNSYYQIQLNRLADFGHLTDREKIEIKEIVSPLINRSLNELLNITYSTKEFKKTSFGEAISL